VECNVQISAFIGEGGKLNHKFKIRGVACGGLYAFMLSANWSIL